MQYIARIGLIMASFLATSGEARQYHVRVSVDQVVAGYQRGKSPDRDYLTISLASTHDLSSRTTTAPTDIGTFETNHIANLSPNVVTDELIVDDSDTISLHVDIENRSHTDPSKTITDGLKIAGGVLATIGAGEAIKAMFINKGNWQEKILLEAGIVGFAGTGIGIAGEAIADLFSSSDPNCDGPVFAPKLPVGIDVGKFFARFPGPIPINVPLPLLIWTDQSQLSPIDCGHAPSATVRVNLVLTQEPIDPPTFGSLPGPISHYKPTAIVGRADSLNGIWSDDGRPEGGRVIVKIGQLSRTYSSIGPNGSRSLASMPQLKGADARLARFFQLDSKYIELLGQPPEVNRITLPTSIGGPGSPSVEIKERLLEVGAADFAIPAAPSEIIPMQSFEFHGNRYPSRGEIHLGAAVATNISSRHHLVKIPPGPMSELSSKTSDSRIEVHNILPAYTAVFADSLPLPGGVTLQIYGGYDDREQFVSSHVRYLRSDATGRVLTDVMLKSAQIGPR